MKSLIIITLLLINLQSAAQQVTALKFTPDSTRIISFKSYGLLVMDSSKRILSIESDSLGYNYKTIQIQGDSLEVIKRLLIEFERTQKRFEVMYAAEDILSHITVNGFVTNWKEWHRSVKRYMKLKRDGGN